MKKNQFSIPWKVLTIAVAVLVVTTTFAAGIDPEDVDDSADSEQTKIIIDLSIKKEKVGKFVSVKVYAEMLSLDNLPTERKSTVRASS